MLTTVRQDVSNFAIDPPTPAACATPARLSLSEPLPAASSGVAVSAVIPCLNEERSLGLCIEKAFRAFAAMQVRGEVVVCDNGSIDRSVEIAERLGARVIHQPVKGYGAALRKGIEEAQGEVIVMADADDSYDWSALAGFVHKIQDGYDLVIGNRFKGGIEQGAMSWLHRYVGNPALSAIARVAFGVRIGDFHCGMRALSKTSFERMKLATKGMEFATEMIANAAHQGLRIAEIPTTLHKDKRDRPPHLRSFRDGWRHLRFILTHAPDYLYIGPGLLCMLLGLLLEVALIAGPVQFGRLYLGIHFLALGSLLTLVGFNILNLGVFAKTIMAAHYQGMRSRISRFVTQRFRLEVGLIFGGSLALAGLAVDAAIFVEWLQRTHLGMVDTVHAAFVATTLAALGLNIVFSSFLLNLVCVSRPPDDTAS